MVWIVKMATGVGVGVETVSDKDNPQKLLLQLVRHILHKGPGKFICQMSENDFIILLSLSLTGKKS